MTPEETLALLEDSMPGLFHPYPDLPGRDPGYGLQTSFFDREAVMRWPGCILVLDYGILPPSNATLARNEASSKQAMEDLRLEFVLACEKVFHIRIEDTEIENLQTVGDLCGLVGRKREERLATGHARFSYITKRDTNPGSVWANEPGIIVKLAVPEGSTIEKGEELYRIQTQMWGFEGGFAFAAPYTGRVAHHIEIGQRVHCHDLLAHILTPA